MKDVLLSDFNVFKKLLVKGTVFIYKNYIFREDDPGKDRPIILLNNNHPKDKNGTIYYSTLSSSRVERYAQSKPKEIIILEDDKLRYPSAFNLKQIIPFNSGKFYEDFLSGIVSNPIVLSKKSLKIINKSIVACISDKKIEETISIKTRRAIFSE